MSDLPFIPYGAQWTTEEDVAAVVDVLRGDWLTTGPKVTAFEEALCAVGSCEHAVAVNSGTSALHCAYEAAGLGPGDVLLTSPLTFAATASTARILGADVRFVDVRADTGNLDPAALDAAWDERVKVVTAIDYAGHPADYDAINRWASDRGVTVVSDAAHSLGAAYQGRPVGSLAHMTAVSLHPVKPITTAEGGAVLTSDPGSAQRARDFRSHGLVRDAARLQDSSHGPWYYEIQQPGLNYRITDLQCALGLSQIGRLGAFIARRQEIAARYDQGLGDLGQLVLPTTREGIHHGWHLYVIRIAGDPALRRPLFERLRQLSLGVQVHYVPVHMHPAYRQSEDLRGAYPVAEDFYARAISIPMFPRLTNEQVDDVIERIRQAVGDVMGAAP